jgi:hypothetical protein
MKKIEREKKILERIEYLRDSVINCYRKELWYVYNFAWAQKELDYIIGNGWDFGGAFYFYWREIKDKAGLK